jgi:hypothetical protein
MSCKKKAIIIILLFFVNHSFCQEYRKDSTDFNAWYTFSLVKEIGKNWKINTDVNFRFVHDARKLNETFFIIGTSKKINKKLELLADIRSGNSQLLYSHRLTFGGEYSHEYKRWVFSLRGFFQEAVFNYKKSDLDVVFKSFWRTRVKFNYKMTNKAEAYLSFEPVMRVGANNLVDQYRTGAGINYRINERFKLAFMYLHRTDYSKPDYLENFETISNTLTYFIKNKT